MQNTITGTAMTITRASGRTTPRWTLATVVVVLKASIIELNFPLLAAPVDSVLVRTDGDYGDVFFSCWAMSVSRRSRMFEIATSWASKCFWISSDSFNTASASL